MLDWVRNVLKNNGKVMGILMAFLVLSGCGNSHSPVKETAETESEAESIAVSEATEETGESESEIIAPEISSDEKTEDSLPEPTPEPEPELIAAEAVTPEPEPTPEPVLASKNGYADGEGVSLDPGWRFAEFSLINSGNAVMYLAKDNRKDIIIGVNAGHGTSGSYDYYTYSHPDQTPKVTGGTTSAGSLKSVSVSSGMEFHDGVPEKSVTLKMAQILKDKLLASGYDVLMIRDGEDVQLDNIARTVICNNAADCHIALHWDGDGLDYDKGCYYMSVPDGIKYLDNVASAWQSSEHLGDCLISGLSEYGNKIFDEGHMDQDLTQTSYSSIPSVDIELGNSASDHSDEKLARLGDGLLKGINSYFGF